MPDRFSNAGDITVLIPAAGRVPEGVLGGVSHISSTALIPVARRPVIYWTLTYLRRLGLSRFHLAVPQRGQFVEDLVECTLDRDCKYEFIEPALGPEGGPGDTVLSLLETVKTPAALVVLGDTHFQFKDAGIIGRGEPFVLTSPVNESYRWCVEQHDERGYVTKLLNKVPNLPPPVNALIGVYYFPSAQRAASIARDAAAGARKRSTRLEIADILLDLHKESPVRAERAGEWLDCGNPDTQADSQMALLQKREFNELSIDATLGTITKRSTYQSKFRDEINYLRLLPADLSVLFPRVLDYSLDWDKLSMTMEYYGYPSLAEIFVYEHMNPAVWQRVFSHLFKIVTGAFMRYRQPIAKESVVDMYLNKTAKRLESLKGSPQLLALRDHRGPININGKACPNLSQIWPRVQEDARKLADNAVGSVIHGDLCFSNILYDLRAQICKFVDPRGSFGEIGLIGDPRYDVAKLYHSVAGMYDFMTNDLFHVSVDGPTVQLDIRARPQHQQIRNRFESIFFPTFDKREIVLITALIFAGIAALHYDSPTRQLAMYARALQLFAELYPLESAA